MRQAYALVRACPSGRVTTYGWIGKALGYPRGARMIGWIMNETPSRADIPAQRVISSTGELTGSWAWGQRGKMRELLESEGVAFKVDDKVDMKSSSWDPTTALSEAERDDLFARADDIAVEISPRFLHLLLTDVASPFKGRTFAG
jgi:methylated-DNA-protein-cysteine methyltransferase-like protein